MKVALCDFNNSYADELDERMAIYSRFAKQTAHEEIDFDVDVFATQEELFDILRSGEKFDFIVLQDESPVISGVDLSAKIREYDNMCQISFVTTPERFMEKSFSAWSDGYLLTPLTQPRVNQFLDFIVLEHTRRNGNYPLPQRDGNKALVPFRDIMYIETRDKYMEAVTYRRRFMFLGTMKEQEANLTPYGFQRVSKNFLVNFAFVATLGEAEISLKNGIRFDFEHKYEDVVKKAFKERRKYTYDETVRPKIVADAKTFLDDYEENESVKKDEIPELWKEFM